MAIAKERRKRKKGVRKADFNKCETIVNDCKLSDEELSETFPEGYVEIGFKESNRVEYTPAKLVVYEDHIYSYRSIKGGAPVTAKSPKKLLSGSWLTPSLSSKIIYDKFINAVPVNRTAREFGWLDATIRPQTICRWLMRLTDRYLYKIYDKMSREILSARLIHADETPFKCVEDQKRKKSKGSKSWMWVYHTADQYNSPPIFVYDYHDNRRTENVERFLSEYKGIVMADGYEPYHAVARLSNGDIKVAGCWAHLKRKFTDVVKAEPKNSKGTVAYEGNRKIARIYYVDNKMKDAPEEERLKYRQEVVKPLVDAFFAWAKSLDGKIATGGSQRAVTYALNQEKYLREFLNSGIIPLDNSDAERSIRSFCVGKHNWHIVSTSSGAKTSAILYSIAETAKANGLKPYEYFKYALEQLLEHEDDHEDEYLDKMMPWSDKLPDHVKANQK